MSNVITGPWTTAGELREVELLPPSLPIDPVHMQLTTQLILHPNDFCLMTCEVNGEASTALCLRSPSVLGAGKIDLRPVAVFITPGMVLVDPATGERPCKVPPKRKK